MRCLRCDKPLVRFAVAIPTREGLRGWGPKCARTVLVQAKATAMAKAKAAPPRDPRQVDWIEQVTA